MIASGAVGHAPPPDISPFLAFSFSQDLAWCQRAFQQSLGVHHVLTGHWCVSAFRQVSNITQETQSSGLPVVSFQRLELDKI